ncbi:hypothetical protein AAF712_011106 [Marasmius tenuissimus]|uniref:Pentatricopeptide repeat-containing protein n=1 Tax=Marasmius tenuissimus TaxID=585030 RepID=A0ABR2ZMT1_9AGAR
MLPSSLVDLTLARINASYNPRTIQRGSRYLQSAALKFKAPQDSSLPIAQNSRRYDNAVKKCSKFENGGLQVRQPARDPTKAISELSRKVRELERIAEEHKAILDPPAYTEEQLMTIYEDLLSNPDVPESTQAEVFDEETLEEKDLAVVSQLDEKFMSAVESSSSTSESLSNMLRRMTTQHRPHKVKKEDLPPEPYRRVLVNVQGVLSDISSLQGSDQASVSPGLLAISEWDSMLRTALRAEDPESAQLVLKLMEETGLEITEERINTVLNYFVEKGNHVGFEKFLKQRIQEEVPSEQQRHLHVKVYLNSTPLSTTPAPALSILHMYENQATPPPMKTYSKVIHRLLTTPNSTSQAQAWDLFAHMRYVSHPDPDVVLYTQMIRACASYFTASRPAEPERALDLWTEMCVEKGITPTTGTYNAVILACARSGRKAYVAEAFRLAKQMLDSNRDAYGQPAYFPDVRTFCALLEGAKRVGDLARVRWILAEMIGHKDERKSTMDVAVNGEVMMHVFHAYATYQVPFRRSMARIIESEEHDDAETQQDQSEEGVEDSQETLPVPETTNPMFTHIPPQTHEEIIREIDILFSRILEDTGLRVNYDTLDDGYIPPPKFSEVKVEARLLNSYLSVYYAHSSLERARTLFSIIFEELGVQRSARSFQEAMVRCANSKQGDRDIALEWAKELMEGWVKSGMETSLETSPRTKEKLHAAYIKVLSLTNHLDEALNHVRSFTSQYPASLARSRVPSKPDYRSMRVSLEAARPLVRLTTSMDVPDDGVPPFLMFEDVEVLHHRLVAMGKTNDIGYLKYVCKSYEWALRVRRDEVLRKKPVHGGNDVGDRSDVEDAIEEDVD